MSAPRGARVVLASAGTGKTYALTTHYLRLLANGVAPERVLAATFTRKAAGEILGRVFTRLAKVVADEPARRALNEDLEASFTREEYLALLARLARSIQRFRVRTLDAFFVELAQLFAADLDLSPGWRIADEVDAARLRGEAIARALADRPIADWVLLLRELERTRAGRPVHETLMRTVDAGHVAFLESGEDAWQRLSPPRPADAAELAAATELLARTPIPANASKKPGVPGKPNSNWQKAVLRAGEYCAAEDWDALLSKNFGKGFVDGTRTFHGIAFPPDLCAAYETFLRHGAALLGAHIQSQNRAARRWLDAYDAQYRSLRLERGEQRFDDLPRALAGVEGGVASRERLSELAFRLDAQIDHLLLDEFQDTSPVQWRVLRPLAEELAADGTGARSVFAVGDPKQSIYGWRSGEPKLLEGLAAELNADVEQLTLSYRSSPVVLDAVNQVFGGLGENPVFDAKDRAQWRPIAQAFASGFAAHEAKHATLPGCARLHVAAAPGDGDSRSAAQLVLERAAELVDEIRERHPQATVGVLMRRNEFLPRLAWLLRKRGIRASGEGGNPLTDSAAVQVVLSLLHLCDHPGDTAAAFHVATSPLSQAAGVRTEQAGDERSARLLELRRAVAERGLPRVLEELRPAVAKGYGPFDERRFDRLVEQAIAWQAQPGPRLSDFVERVRATKVVDAGSSAVQVMTIHRAKGLEFDAVVMAELDQVLLKRQTPLVTRRRGGDPTRELEAVSRNANAGARALLAAAGDPLLQDLDREQRMRELRDDLCGLYVGMTRARHQLDLVVQPDAPKETDEPSEPEGADAPDEPEKLAFSCAGILRGALVHGALEPSKIAWTAADSDTTWQPAAAKPVVASSDAEPAVRALRFAPSRRPRELERASASRLEHADQDLDRMLSGEPDDARRRGHRLHAWLECVAWLEDFRASDAELLQIAGDRDLGGEGVERDLADFRRMLQGPRVRELLARPAGDVEVWRERRFDLALDLDGNGRKLWSGAFDRVVLAREGGRVVSADLIDFKSFLRGAPPPDLAAKRELYRPQLEAYAAILAHITGLDVKRIRKRIAFLDVDKIVEW